MAQKNPNAVIILNTETTKVKWCADRKTSMWQWQTSMYGKYTAMTTTWLHANHSEKLCTNIKLQYQKKTNISPYIHTHSLCTVFYSRSAEETRVHFGNSIGTIPGSSFSYSASKKVRHTMMLVEQKSKLHCLITCTGMHDRTITARCNTAAEYSLFTVLLRK